MHAGSSLWRRALTLSNSSGHLLRVIAPAVVWSPCVAYSPNEESTLGLYIGVAVEVPCEDWLVEAPTEVVSEGVEAKGVKEVVETAFRMLVAVIETGEAGSVAGFAEAVEAVDMSRVWCPKFEVAGTVAAAGPAEELDLGPSMP
ncbi:hypothetical protein Nepgr_014557 [Nepenthes gracilis]|uniref:Uncharacterized protein n=1 Tax=Nepenthes gracilis TaxID=150966 RepID=A0AAD3SM20_NEPGR|nr:hypothetical protein Nepgr_014557 [Nepenthes gracilis]